MFGGGVGRDLGLYINLWEHLPLLNNYLQVKGGLLETIKLNILSKN